MGARLTKVDFNQMGKVQVQEFVQGYSTPEDPTQLTQKYKADQLTEEQLEQSYRRVAEQAEVSYNRTFESFERPKAFGYTEEERINLLREAGVRSTDIFRIVRAWTCRSDKSAEDPGRAVHRNRRRQEQETCAIRELRTGDAQSKFLAESLQREHNRRINDEKRGRTPQDKLPDEHEHTGARMS